MTYMVSDKHSYQQLLYQKLQLLETTLCGFTLITKRDLSGFKMPLTKLKKKKNTPITLLIYQKEWFNKNLNTDPT